MESASSPVESVLRVSFRTQSCEHRGLPNRELVSRNHQSERGAGHLKAIIWTLILLSLIYAAFKVVPVLIQEYEFQDSIINIARFATANRQNNDQVKQEVLRVVEKQELPIQADQIKVEGSGGNVHIRVDYSVNVDLMVYQWNLDFHPAADNKALF